MSEFNEFGIVGLGVMGSNIAQNLLDHDVTLSVYDINTDVSKRFSKTYGSCTYQDLKGFVESLHTPRKILIMVTAGKPVDAVIEGLSPYLDPHDIVIDGGNSYYKDTAYRQHTLSTHSIDLVSLGISGGADGARYGASLMPSGSKQAVHHIMPMLLKLAAQSHHKACVEYLGHGAAGHFIKMVHNGIEYAEMQILCDAYAILKHVFSMKNEDISDVFNQWNQGKLASYLVEITAHILKTQDALNEGLLIDAISDRAQSKGTGKWTVQYAIEQDIPCNMLFNALDVRNRSQKDRTNLWKYATVSTPNLNQDQLENAVYASKIMAYVQGFEILEHASKQYEWDLDFRVISQVWRAGCIIQGRLMNEIHTLFTQDNVTSLGQSDAIQRALMTRVDDWAHCVSESLKTQTHIPVISAGLNDYIGSITPTLSTNLVQAMRDCFGGHTYTRNDREGTFHTQWLKQHGISEGPSNTMKERT